jgi:hypothetical protein
VSVGQFQSVTGLSLTDLSDLSSPPVISALKYPHIISSQETPGVLRCFFLCHIHISIISTVGAKSEILWFEKYE